MGIIKAVVGVFTFILAMTIIMMIILPLLAGFTGIMNTANNTTMYATNTDGQVVAVGASNAGGDLTWTLLYGIGFFATIGFIIWLVLRAPTEPDYPTEQYTQGRF